MILFLYKFGNNLLREWTYRIFQFCFFFLLTFCVSMLLIVFTERIILLLSILVYFLLWWPTSHIFMLKLFMACIIGGSKFLLFLLLNYHLYLMIYCVVFLCLSFFFVLNLLPWCVFVNPAHHIFLNCIFGIIKFLLFWKWIKGWKSLMWGTETLLSLSELFLCPL